MTGPLILLPLTAAANPEVIDRVPAGYNHFVIPFVVGAAFALTWIGVGLIRNIASLPGADRRKFLLSLFNPTVIAKNLRDLFCDCLFHVKIWKRKPLLGYMHSAIAFGWFMLIILGHIEVALFVPKRLAVYHGGLYYPIFYRFFVWVNPEHTTLRGAFFFFLMDFFLLYVLSGIALAMFKRIRSIALGMRHTTKPSLADRLALYSLWGIFPLRLMAESFTANLSGGSFLTVPMNMLLRAVFGNNLNIMPFWWAYSICLGLFFLAMPFSRYMHILTEVLLILQRNAGLRIRELGKGYSEAQIYACPSCGLCLDACPMNIQKKNLRYSSVYLVRFLRRHNKAKVEANANKCLMCGKCLAICPVGVEAPEMRRIQRSLSNDRIGFDYTYLQQAVATRTPRAEGKVLYFAGCMSHLTPRIIKGVESVLQAAGIEYVFADREGGLCCGRPLLLAGRDEAARSAIAANREMIRRSGCTTLLVSCPICYKVFREEYGLEGIRIVHYTEYFEELVRTGRLRVARRDIRYVYHDPCELGRGCGIYEEPRELLGRLGTLGHASKERDESVCCGGSLGSLTLDARDRARITEGALQTLLDGDPQAIVTACPLCLKTFSAKSPVPVKDFAETLQEHLMPSGGPDGPAPVPDAGRMNGPAGPQ